MPGISGLISKKRDNTYLDIFLKYFNALLHSKNYQNNLIHKGRDFVFGYTFYRGYPVKIFQNSNTHFYLEGYIYNKETNKIQEEIREIYDTWVKGKDYNKLVKEFIFDSDGEYIVLLFDREKGNLLLFNDFLGRLPLYFYTNDNFYFFSREIIFVKNMIQTVSADIQGICEYLLFLYPLSNRTLIENTSRFPAFSLLEYRQGKFNIKKLYEYNFENKKREQRKIEEIGRELGEFFFESCKRRSSKLKDFKKLLGLSGGLDSRAVLLGLKKNKDAFIALTALDYEGHHRSNANVARIITKRYDVEWKLIKLDKTNIEDMEKLIYLKQGLNGAEMAFAIDFFKKTKELLGDNIVFFSGDGGDKCLPYHLPHKFVNLTDWIILKNSVFTLKEVEMLTGRKCASILEILNERINEYPEKDKRYKYIHFLIYERAFKWLFEGEDRNRYFLWTVAPFYSLNFFKNAFEVEDKYKQFYKLYKEFFKFFDKESVFIEKADWGHSLSSVKVYYRELFKKFSFITKLYTKIRKSSYTPPHEKIMKYISLLTREEKNIKEILNTKCIASLEKDFNKVKLYTLFSLLLFLKKLF